MYYGQISKQTTNYILNFFFSKSLFYPLILRQIPHNLYFIGYEILYKIVI